ncbi:MAG: hypothetical protein ACRELY_00265 [Polyangiaceae bacterium]
MSSLILPPRLEDRGAELEATYPVIPVYEEVSGSLRPTWIPVDPTTFIPPAPKKSRAKKLALVTTLALLTWGVGFAAVVGGHTAMQRYGHPASAAAASPVSDPSPVVTVAPVAQRATPAKVASTNVPPTSQRASGLGDSGIMFTVDVNDLPVIKEKPHGAKSRGPRRRDAGS